MDKAIGDEKPLGARVKSKDRGKMVASNSMNNTYTFYLRVTKDNALPLTAPIVGRYTLHEINFIKFVLIVKNLKITVPN